MFKSFILFVVMQRHLRSHLILNSYIEFSCHEQFKINLKLSNVNEQFECSLEYHIIHAFMYWSTLVSFSLSFCKALQFEIETSMILQFDNLLSQCKIDGSKINCI